MSVKNSFGLGGGSSKSRLVADLTDEYKKLNTVLKETEKLSKSIASSMGGIKGGGNSATNAMSQMTGVGAPPAPGGPGGPAGPSGPPGPGGPGGPGGGTSTGYSSSLRTMAGAAVTALATGVDAEQYVTNDIARRRFGFFSGVYSRNNDNIGTIAGMQAFKALADRGTATSAMDAANAAMAGNSNGLMGGLKNYNTIINSVAGVSNMMPGAGLEGGMGAIAALNQGSSVNKLRMIGINVRDQKGFMRDIEDIARDLWKTINNTKSGKGNISESDLAYSLQPGNSLAMLMDQYFGSDAVLKQSVISYLYQFAKNNGAKVGGGYTSEAGRAELNTTGANPGITQSIGRRNAAGTANVNAYTSAGAGGVQTANDIITATTQLTASLAPLLEVFVGATTAGQTLAAGGSGTGGILMKGALDASKGLQDAAASATKALLDSPAGLAIIGAGAVAVAGRAMTQKIDETWAKKIADGSLSPTDNGPSWAGLFGDSNIYPDITGGSGGSSGGTASGGSSGGSAGGNSGNVRHLSAGGIVPAGYMAPTSTTAGWSKKLLQKLGYKPTKANLDAIQAWVTHEGGINDRNNPLNIRGVKGIYATEDIGIKATADLLNANQAPTDQYYKINQALKNGTDEGATWAAIATSPWDATQYGTQKAGKAQYYGPGGTININITGADLKDSKQLAKDIKEQIDNAIQQQGVRGGNI